MLLDRRRGHGGSTDSAERLKTIECLTPLIAIGLLKSAMPELAPTSALKFTHPGVERARELMRRNFREPLGVAELAAQACLSRSQFIAAFKKQVGATPHDYLRKLRVIEAKRLLKEGRGVTETAFAVGFGSLSGFEEAFSELAGLTPAEYRRQSRA